MTFLCLDFRASLFDVVVSWRGKKNPSRGHNVAPQCPSHFPSAALNLSSRFPNGRKCGYIFTRIRFALKPPLSRCIPAVRPLSTPRPTLHPLNPPVTGYYHRSLIFGFVSNNMAPVNHVRLTTVTATALHLPLADRNVYCRPSGDNIALGIFSKTDATTDALTSPHIILYYYVVATIKISTVPSRPIRPYNDNIIIIVIIIIIKFQSVKLYNSVGS